MDVNEVRNGGVVVASNGLYANHLHFTPDRSACMHARTHTLYYSSGFCPGLPGLAGTRRNIHPFTPIMVISHPLSSSSIYYNPWHPPCSIYVPDSLFPQSLLVIFGLLLVVHPHRHTPYISSPSHCLFSQHIPLPSQPVLL